MTREFQQSLAWECSNCRVSLTEKFNFDCSCGEGKCVTCQEFNCNCPNRQTTPHTNQCTGNTTKAEHRQILQRLIDTHKASCSQNSPKCKSCTNDITSNRVTISESRDGDYHKECWERIKSQSSRTTITTITEQRFSELEQRLSQAQIQIDTLNSQIVATENSLKTTTEELAETKQELATNKKAISSLESELNKRPTAKQFSDSQEQIKDLSAKLVNRERGLLYLFCWIKLFFILLLVLVIFRMIVCFIRCRKRKLKAKEIFISNKDQVKYEDGNQND